MSRFDMDPTNPDATYFGYYLIVVYAMLFFIALVSIIKWLFW